jgi:hypothetical protein
MQLKLLIIITVNFKVTDQLLITFCICNILRKTGSTMGHTSFHLYISKQPKIQSE